MRVELQRNVHRAISPRASLGLRLRVFVRRGRLDRTLIHLGAEDGDAALRLRARQLTTPKARRRASRNLRGIVKHVERLGSQLDLSAVVIDRHAVWAARQALLGLADRLEGAGHVNPRGMVLAMALVTDGGSSPVYGQGARTLVDAIWEISDALGDEAPDDSDVRPG